MSFPKSLIVASLASGAIAFSPAQSNTKSSTSLKAIASVALKSEDDRELYDPLNLYSANSPERKMGLIKSLEPDVNVIKPVLDPLNLYSNKAEVDDDVDLSASLPFVPRPSSLTGELAGDVGFDPFNFASTEEKLLWQREAELKHSRIAMLAVVGWPLSELLDKPLASVFHMDSLLGSGDRVPSLLNGGLDQVNPLYWVFVLAAASTIELLQVNNDDASPWDPLGLYPKDANDQQKIEQAEIMNGRMAMLGITGFAIQEFFTNKAVMEPLLPAHF